MRSRHHPHDGVTRMQARQWMRYWMVGTLPPHYLQGWTANGPTSPANENCLPLPCKRRCPRVHRGVGAKPYTHGSAVVWKVIDVVISSTSWRPSIVGSPASNGRLDHRSNTYWTSSRMQVRCKGERSTSARIWLSKQRSRHATPPP